MDKDKLVKSDSKVNSLMKDIVDDFINLEKKNYMTIKDDVFSTKELLEITDTKAQDVLFIKNDNIVLKEKDFVNSVDESLLCPEYDEQNYAVTQDYKEWLHSIFYIHKNSKKILFSEDQPDDELSVFEIPPEDLSLIESKLEQIYGIDMSLFRDMKNFMLAPVGLVDGKEIATKTVILESNEQFKEFLEENDSFIPYCFMQYFLNGCKFLVRGNF